MCPLNFILPFLYFSSRFDFFAPKENWREIFKSKSRVSKKTLYLTKYIFTYLDLIDLNHKSFQTPKKRCSISSNKPGTKITTMRYAFSFFHSHPTHARVQDQPENRIARDNPTVFSRFQFQVASFLSSFLLLLSFSFSQRVANKQTTPHVERQRRDGEGDGEAMRRKGWEETIRKAVR